MSSPSDPHRIFDRTAVRLHRDRAARHVDAVRDLLESAADRLLDRLDDITRRFTRALDIGGRGVIAPRLAARGMQVISCDLSARMAARAGGLPVVADEEFLPFADGAFDLVIAALSLHWVNDLPGTLLQIRRTLSPDGLFIAALPGLGTLHALRTALAEAEESLSGGVSPRVSPFPDLRDAAGLLQRAGFALPVADSDEIEIRYKNPLALLHDLRHAGETNAIAQRNRRPPPRDLFPAALARMTQDDGRIPATLRLIVMTGWAPAPTQQKPLARGSAQTSLIDALRTQGDKTT